MILISTNAVSIIYHRKEKKRKVKKKKTHIHREYLTRHPSRRCVVLSLSRGGLERTRDHDLTCWAAVRDPPRHGRFLSIVVLPGAGALPSTSTWCYSTVGLILHASREQCWSQCVSCGKNNPDPGAFQMLNPALSDGTHFHQNPAATNAPEKGFISMRRLTAFSGKQN